MKIINFFLSLVGDCLLLSPTDIAVRYWTGLNRTPDFSVLHLEISLESKFHSCNLLTLILGPKTHPHCAPHVFGVHTHADSCGAQVTGSCLPSIGLLRSVVFLSPAAKDAPPLISELFPVLTELSTPLSFKNDSKK